jgi:hypothetical protein
LQSLNDASCTNISSTGAPRGPKPNAAIEFAAIEFAAIEFAAIEFYRTARDRPSQLSEGPEIARS